MNTIINVKVEITGLMIFSGEGGALMTMMGANFVTYIGVDTDNFEPFPEIFLANGFVPWVALFD